MQSKTFFSGTSVFITHVRTQKKKYIEREYISGFFSRKEKKVFYRKCGDCLAFDIPIH